MPENTYAQSLELKLYRFFFIVFCSLSFLQSLHALTYTVSIKGVEDNKLLKELCDASVTYSSPDKEVPTPITLKLRAMGDVDRLKSVAQNAGFFNCVVEPVVTFSDGEKGTVTFNLNLGPRFTFGKLSILWCDEDLVRSFFASHPDWLEKRIPSSSLIPSYRQGDPVTGKRILAIPEELRDALRAKGYAFCKIVNTEVVADRADQTVDVKLTVQTGPITRFGPIQVYGTPNVEEACFKSNLAWKTGDFYTPKLIEKTENALQQTGLFQSVQIDEGDSLSDDWMLPMIIRVTEAKQRTISAGISYTTTYGAGLSGSWEHRNISGLGRKLSVQAQFWEKLRIAQLSYTIPFFLRNDQNLIWVLGHTQQTYLPFESATTQGSVLIDRQLSKRMDGIAGVTLERLSSHGIVRSELFHLCKFPCQMRWSSANSPLDPTKGVCFSIKLTPSYQILSPTFSYLIHMSTLAGYTSFYEDKLTFAMRLQFGNITGAARNTIPLPDRLFGGSDNSLRGYKTGSVSPLNKYGQPIGGKSMVTGTVETRIRTSTNIGWVAFYDAGNVFSQVTPSFSGFSLLHSVGLGFRYKTPIGPLRLDLGIPLQRRKHLDPAFQIYFSIGQAF